MKSELKSALSEQLLAMGDDEFILGHRDSEWCGHAPILEEDIAFANLALDEIGHASLWYTLLAELQGEQDPQAFSDRLVFFRPPGDFRNVQMVELDNGDWAFSMLRQYLFDAAEAARLKLLTASEYSPLAATAARIRKEEIYHSRHTHAWIERLGLGTEESHSRLQKALDELWPYAQQLFVPLPFEKPLVSANFLPASDRVKAVWLELVISPLAQAQLKIPVVTAFPARRDQHSGGFKSLVEEMQSVARLEPEAEW